MYKKIFFLLLVATLLSGCAKQTVNQNKSSVKQGKIETAFDCQQSKENFQDYTWFFEDKDYVIWCEECVERNGRPQASHDGGPFCNIKTGDVGKRCTDSSQCEGYCIAENQDDNSGFCTEYQELDDGCGWLELIDGEVAELCVS